MESKNREKIAVKVILVGDGAVGKTSLRRRYMGQGFNVSYIETVGADFASKTIDIDPHLVHLSIWDLASQSIYRGMRSTFYKGASIVIIVYDVSALVSFKSVHFWLEEAMRMTSDTIKTLLLVGNKSDLVELRQVTTEEGELAAKELSEISKTPVLFIETSALTGENIEEAFYLISKEYVESIGIEVLSRQSKKNVKVGNVTHIPTTDGSVISSTPSSEDSSLGTIPKEALDELTTKITYLENSQSKLKANLSSVKKALTSLEQSKETALQDEKPDLSSELNSLSTKVSELDGLSTKVSEIDSLSAKVSELDGLSAKVSEIDGLSAKVSELDGLSANISEISSLKEGLNAIEGQLPDIESINSKLDDLSSKTNQIDSFDSSLQKLEKLIEPLTTLTDQISILNDKTAAIEEEFDTIKILMGRLMQVIQKVANALKEEETSSQDQSTSSRSEWMSSDDLDFLDNLSKKE